MLKRSLREFCGNFGRRISCIDIFQIEYCLSNFVFNLLCSWIYCDKGLKNFLIVILDMKNKKKEILYKL